MDNFYGYSRPTACPNRRKSRSHQGCINSRFNDPRMNRLAVSISRGIIINEHARPSMHPVSQFCFHLVPRSLEAAIWLEIEKYRGRKEVFHHGRIMLQRTYWEEDDGRERAVRARESGHAMRARALYSWRAREPPPPRRFFCGSAGNGCQLSATWTCITGHCPSPELELENATVCVVLRE